MTAPDSPLDRRAFLASALGAGALVSLGDFTRLLDHWQLAAANPATQAWPPLGANRAFEIVVIGDSIMWGQGLSEDETKNQKFTFKVKRFVEQRMPGIEVHLHNFAHSGAQILADDHEDDRPADYGEIPNYFPSINWQLGRCIAELAGTGVSRRYVPPIHAPTSPESVALVILDGGINDIGTKKILTPDPTILSNPVDPASGAEWIRRATREQCVDRMRKLLTRVLTNFPNAKVVVTNYYSIVSDQSDPVYLWELLRFWGLIGRQLEWSQAWLMAKLEAQSFAFHDELTKGFRTVVAEAKPLEVIASGAASSVARANRGSLEGAIKPLSPPRAAFAEIPFGEENSYAAPQTNLFYLNEPDPAMAVRREKCMDKYHVLNPNCTLAAGGHPNVRGAQVYANTIIAALKKLVPEWATTPTTKRLPEGVRP